MNYRQWYQNTYSELHRAGLWLRGGELNTLALSEYDSRQFRMMLVRLSTYFDTGYSFTHQILYQLAANTPGVYPDLGYLPPRQDVPIFERDNVPWLIGTQSKFGPSGFDLIGFSNSIVQELINLPTFLEKSGIPLSKRERLDRGDIPLLIMGGANALYSSVFWGEDSVIDGIFVGESDLAFRQILEICRNGKKSGISKREILRELEGVSGFIQPDHPKPSRKNFITNLNQSEALERGPVYFIDEQLGNSHLQISEGCPAFCSFCAESWDRKPYRERSAEVLRETALRAKAAMGLDSIDIYSFNFNMHSGFYQVLWDLVLPFRNVGLKSQRFDLLAHDPQMVEYQHAIEKASITCGLEGISPRLRKYLHKNLENEQLHKSIGVIFKSKARELKMFLIATGLEEEQDFVALDDLLDHLKEIKNAAHSGTRIIFSMTPLVRFPWTPLEFENAYSVEHYQRIINRAAQRVRAAGFEFRESADLPEYWVSQVLVRAADKNISKALLSALKNTRFIYYRELPESFMLEFTRQLKAVGLVPEDLLRGFDLEASESKPWTFVQTGVKREFLWEEVKRARSYVEIDYCLGRNWTKAKCFHCGGCPSRYHVRDIVLAAQKRNYSLDQFKNRISLARKSESVIRFRVVAGEACRGTSRKLLGVAVARAIMLTDGRLTPHYRGFAGAYWADFDKEVYVTGDDYVALTWNSDAIEHLKELLGDQAGLAEINNQMGEWGVVHGFADSQWRPSRVEIQAPFELKADGYLKARGLKHTLRKQSDGSYLFEFIPQSIKKGFVAKMITSKDECGMTRVILELGSKFVPREFATEAFSLPRRTDWVKIAMRSI